MVYFGSDVLGTYSLSAGDSENFSELVTGSGALRFDLTAPPSGAVGAVLDSASISTTPEPSSLALLGTGIVGMAGFVRRKIRRTV